VRKLKEKKHCDRHFSYITNLEKRTLRLGTSNAGPVTWTSNLLNNISMTLKTPICALLLLVVTHSFRSVCGIKSGLFRFSSVKSGVVRSGMLQFIGVKTSSGQFFSLANFFAKKGNSKFKSSKMN